MWWTYPGVYKPDPLGMLDCESEDGPSLLERVQLLRVDDVRELKLMNPHAQPPKESSDYDRVEPRWSFEKRLRDLRPRRTSAMSFTALSCGRAESREYPLACDRRVEPPLP